MNRFSLVGRNAFVTGGSRGIGRAIAIALADAGANVAIGFRANEAEAQRVVHEIKSQDRRVLAVKMDVTDRASVIAAAEEVQKLGPTTILVNNAGINKPTDFDAVTDEDWDSILATNLRGPFVCAQVFLPYMEKAGGGSIVYIGSVSGQYGGPRTAHYAASKAGLESLAQVIARFGAPRGVRSNVVAAGIIASDMGSAGLAAPSVQKAAEAILLKRLGTHQEVADAVVFLSSDASSYITAQTINVNGGLYF
jgi:3-oxoacyl-[acyl-carrier protein] reductase